MAQVIETCKTKIGPGSKCMTFVHDGNVYEAGHTQEFNIGCPLCNSLLYIYQGIFKIWMDFDALTRCF